MTTGVINRSAMTFNSALISCFVYALIIYLPSTAVISASMYYVIAIGVIIYTVLNRGANFNVAFIFFVCLFCASLLASLLGYFGFLFIESYDLAYRDNFIPLQISLIASLLIANTINREIAFFIVVFILCECIAGLIQFSLGIKTFFPFVNEAYNEVGVSSGLLYFKRVYGFANNSSGFAGNILVMATLTAVFLKDASKLFRYFVFTIALFAIVCSFTRSAIIAYAVFLFFYVIVNSGKINPVRGFFCLILFLLIVVSLISYLDWGAISDQLNRGRSGQDLSGRDVIWSIYVDYIGQHPFFGNFSLRNYLYIPVYEYMHAHNSFLMAVYILGIIPSVFIFIPFIFIRVWKYKDNIYLIGLLVYSSAQYYLLWGASIADIAFFSVILFSYKHYKTINKYTDI
ncbi:O-antigen ligase family protein [Aeromonas media]|uniref:O-antigen ligase family protein n=1 Tax=Aeromonas media TaxID=651 RepID=UPI003D06FD52